MNTDCVYLIARYLTGNDIYNWSRVFANASEILKDSYKCRMALTIANCDDLEILNRYPKKFTNLNFVIKCRLSRDIWQILLPVMENVEILSIQENYLEHVNFASLESIQVLHLSFTNMKNWDETSLVHLKNLRILIIRCTGHNKWFTGKSLQFCSSLETLNLSDFRANEKILTDTVKGLKKLKNLIIGETTLTKTLFRTILTNELLTELCICCSIYDFHVTNVNRLDTSPVHLPNLTKLSVTIISSTHKSCIIQCFGEIFKNCPIRYLRIRELYPGEPEDPILETIIRNFTNLVYLAYEGTSLGNLSRCKTDNVNLKTIVLKYLTLNRALTYNIITIFPMLTDIYLIANTTCIKRKYISYLLQDSFVNLYSNMVCLDSCHFSQYKKFRNLKSHWLNRKYLCPCPFSKCSLFN